MGFKLPGLSNLFGGGGSDNSTTSSGGILNKAQENLSTSATNTVGASNDSLAFSAKGDVTLVDPAATEAAFRFASESLGLLERNVGVTQRAFDSALAQTLGIADAEKTGGSQRVMFIAAFALAAVVVFTLVKR